MFAEAAFAEVPFASLLDADLPPPDPEPQASTSRRPAAGPRFHAEIDGKIVQGTREQIERLLAQLALEHAQEDEVAIEAQAVPEKRAIRVIGLAQATTKPATEAAVSLAPHIAQETGLSQAQAEAIYRRAYVKAIEAEAIRRDDEDIAQVTEQVRRRRRAAGEALIRQILAIKDMLH